MGLKVRWVKSIEFKISIPKQCIEFCSILTRRGSQVSASDCFEFRICFRAPKNKIYVFYSGPFSYLGAKPSPKGIRFSSVRPRLLWFLDMFQRAEE